MFQKRWKEKKRKNFAHTCAYASMSQMFQFPDERRSITLPSPQNLRHFGSNTHSSELPQLLVWHLQSPSLFDMGVELPHKDRTAIIFLSSTHTSKGRNELCVNRRQWIKRVAWRRTSCKSEGGSSDTVLYVSTLRWEQTAQLCLMHPVCLAIWCCRSNCALHPFCAQQ